MGPRRKLALLLFFLATLPAIAIVASRSVCPSTGIALTQSRRDFHRLKNRTALPSPTDFNHNVTLQALLEPGQESNRWSASQAAMVEGYVVSVAPGPLEATNCFAPGRRDTHIHVGLRPDAPAAEVLVLETTPRMEDWATRQGWDWSADNLKKTLQGRKVRFEGWLMFDMTHADESENVAPRRPGNWRATAWEIHPVTKFEVIE